METALAPNDRLCRASHVVSVAQGGQAVLLDTLQCQYHTLNDVGTRIWQFLAERPRFRVILEKLCAEYDAPADRVASDATALIAELRSIGLVNIERRVLPIADGDRPSPLPALYATWVEHILDGPLPDESHATCHECAMALPVGQGATANASQFDPSVKCCSYLPVLPNFLVGQILHDTSEGGSIGRESVRRRLSSMLAVTPLGIGMSPDYATIYKHATPLFGKSEALRCPHFVDANGGSCGIWRYRNSVCTTFFCKFGRGAVGKAFWDALRDLLGLAEGHVAIWCAREVGLDVESLGHAMLWHLALLPPWLDGGQDGWGKWRGREEQFYIATAELVQGLSWSRIVELGGIELRAAILRVRNAYTTHQQFELPESLCFEAVARVELGPFGTAFSGYHLNDMLVVPAALADTLHHFDGRHSTANVLRTIAAETGESINADTLGRLVDFKVLVPLPDLVGTDLAASIRAADTT